MRVTIEDAKLKMCPSRSQIVRENCVGTDCMWFEKADPDRVALPKKGSGPLEKTMYVDQENDYYYCGAINRPVKVINKF